jgi:RNA polymerase sigma factor (sigma-70 family)
VSTKRLGSKAASSTASFNTGPPAPTGFEDFFRAAFRSLVATAMYAGATLEEGEDAAAKTLLEMLQRWDASEQSLSYARKAVVHNFIKDKTRGTRRVVLRLIERGEVPNAGGAHDNQLTALEDEEWVTGVLSVLPPAQREVMDCIARGLDRNEIAEALGKSKEAIRRNLCDARARLVRELNADEEDQQPHQGLDRSAGGEDR